MVKKLYLKYYIKIFVLFFIFCIFYLINTKNLLAEQGENELIINWGAENFVPINFKGKILPTVGSNISVAVNLIQKNKLVDLSKTTLYWYINNKLVSNSVGVQKINFVAPPPPNSIVDVRVELPELGILKTIEIPITKPRLVIATPFPQKEVKTNYFEIEAIPYFFNLTNNDLDYLDIKWLINGQQAISSIDNPLLIKVNISDENIRKITIEAFAQNTEIASEKTNKRVELILIK